MSEGGRWNVTLEVKVVTLLLTLVPLLHVAMGLILMSGGASGRALWTPIGGLILSWLVAGGLALRMPFSRFVGYGVVGLFGLQHAFFLLSAELWWVKVFSGLAAAGYIYAGVLLSSAPVLRHVGSAKA